MIAILATKGTTYDCNLISESDFSHVTLERFPRLQSYLVPLEKHCHHIFTIRFGFMVAIIFSPLTKVTKIAYMVLMVTLIAIIYGPFHKNYCNHMRSGPIKPLDYWK